MTIRRDAGLYLTCDARQADDCIESAEWHERDEYEASKAAYDAGWRKREGWAVCPRCALTGE